MGSSAGGKYLVGRLDADEPFDGGRVGVQIRVVATGQVPECRPDVVLARTAVDAEYRVQVAAKTTHVVCHLHRRASSGVFNGFLGLAGNE
jgi:hypothetical protein